MMALRWTLFLPLTLLLSGCQEDSTEKLIYGMGERVANKPLSYVVVESSWANQLGENFQIRIPRNRFLMITLSVTNGGGGPISLPLLNLEDGKGNRYQEVSDASGLTNSIGILRTVDPGQTLQGRLLFDVPLTSFKLHLPNDGEPGFEKFVAVNIPLRIDSDQVVAPLPGGSFK